MSLHGRVVSRDVHMHLITTRRLLRQFQWQGGVGKGETVCQYKVSFQVVWCTCTYTHLGLLSLLRLVLRHDCVPRASHTQRCTIERTQLPRSRSPHAISSVPVTNVVDHETAIFGWLRCQKNCGGLLEFIRSKFRKNCFALRSIGLCSLH
jgi:hypothetical protein